MLRRVVSEGGMEKKAQDAGVRIFKSDPVASIDKMGKSYVVVSKSHLATATQWWPDAWWDTAVAGKHVHRAWTTEHCLNHIEIPVDTYGKAQKVTRSVYDDDQRCVAFWEELQKRDVALLDAKYGFDLAVAVKESALERDSATTPKRPSCSAGGH